MKVKIKKVLEEIKTVSDYRKLISDLIDSKLFSRRILSDAESATLMDYGVKDLGELDPDDVLDFVWSFLYKLWEFVPHGFNRFMFNRCDLREKAIRKLKINWEF